MTRPVGWSNFDASLLGHRCEPACQQATRHDDPAGGAVVLCRLSLHSFSLCLPALCNTYRVSDDTGAVPVERAAANRRGRVPVLQYVERAPCIADGRPLLLRPTMLQVDAQSRC